MVYSLFVSWLLTEAIELPLAAALGVRGKTDVLTVILVNIMTNPPLVLSVLLLRLYAPFGIVSKINLIILFAEAAVVLVEGVVYSKALVYRKINPFLLSAILNIVSYSAGELIKIIY